MTTDTTAQEVAEALTDTLWNTLTRSKFVDAIEAELNQAYQRGVEAGKMLAQQSAGAMVEHPPA